MHTGPSISASHLKIDLPKQENFTMHTHDNYEILCFLAGDTDYAVEGSVYELHRGDLMLMRRAEAHHLIVRSEKPYERITVNFRESFLDTSDPDHRLLAAFNDRPLGKGNRFPAAAFPDSNWLYYLQRICACRDEETRRIYLLPLLYELCEAQKVSVQIDDAAKRDAAADVAAYINDHLADPLSLDRICRHFYLSKSQLNRTFRKSTGSTVWEYVTVKRLMRAREEIEKGRSVKAVAAECGFRDYTTFYKAYLRRFGHSPKKTGGKI